MKSCKTDFFLLRNFPEKKKKKKKKMKINLFCLQYLLLSMNISELFHPFFSNISCTHNKETGPVFTNHSQEYSLSFYPRFVNLNVTQLLIG